MNRHYNFLFLIYLLVGSSFAGATEIDDWIGEYGNVRLDIDSAIRVSSDGTFEFKSPCTHGGDVLNVTTAKGRWNKKLEWIEISYLDNLAATSCEFPSKLYLLAWGKKHYLATADALLFNVNQTNAGHSNQTPGWIRIQDLKLQAPKCHDLLPAEFQNKILKKPIQGEITKVSEQGAFLHGNMPNGPPDIEHRSTVTLNLGSNEGIFVGMVLWPAQQAGPMTVTKVNDHYSEATTSLFVSQGKPVPENQHAKIGWHLSSIDNESKKQSVTNSDMCNK